MTTRAAILVRPGRPLVVDEVEVPPLEGGQVLVSLRAAGVCRTQLGEARGWRGRDPWLPHLLGHEGAGDVVATGAGVKKVKPGDYVVVSWIKGAGQEVPGPRYRWKRRWVNAGAAAVFAEQAVVAENRVTKISPRLPAAVAALLGCAVATGAGAVRHLLAPGPATSLVVFGVGGVGASAVVMAQALGCRHLVAVDVLEEKLRWARRLGATHTVRWQGARTAAAVLKVMPGGGDGALEASGMPAAGQQAWRSLARRGLLVIAGHPSPGARLCVDQYGLISGKRVVGTWGGETVPRRDFPYYAREYLAGRLPLARLVTHHYKLPRINEALRVLERGVAGRVVIDFDDD